MISNAKISQRLKNISGIPTQKEIIELFELCVYPLPVIKNKITMCEYSQQEIECQIAYHKFYADRCNFLLNKELKRLTMLVEAGKSYMLAVETKDPQLVEMYKTFLSELMDYHVRKRMAWEVVYEKQTGKQFDVSSLTKKSDI